MIKFNGLGQSFLRTDRADSMETLADISELGVYHSVHQFNLPSFHSGVYKKISNFLPKQNNSMGI